MWVQNVIETPRGRFEYFVSGEGEPLAITHLYLAFDERGNWFANPFTERYKVFLMNMRGAGNSSPIEDDKELGLKEIVKDLEAIRETLYIERWAFAGHSTGGMVALQYAVDAQQSLSKMIGGCTAASKEYANHPSSIYCAENKHFERILEIMILLNNQSILQAERQKLNYEWALMSYHSEDKLKLALSRPSSGRTIGRALDYFRKVEVKHFDLRNELKKIRIPAYIFAGRYDAQCPVEFGIEIANLLPNAALTIFEQSNHHPFIEEEVLFREFVKSTV